jgi:hypothetical protein
MEYFGHLNVQFYFDVSFIMESANRLVWKASADLSIFPAKPVNSISQWRTFILVNQLSLVRALNFPG